MRKMLLAVAVLGLASGVGYAWDVYQDDVPDVEKADHGQAGQPTCWLAAAANQLAAAGWSYGNADTIYEDLLLQFHWEDQNKVKHYYGGWCNVAASWWLTNIGRNQQNGRYDPSNSNWALHVHNSPGMPGIQGAQADDWPATGANYSDYHHLLDELAAGYRVSIGIRPDLETGGHCITLVGGNYYNQVQIVNACVWHDNEGDQSPPNPDDSYNNTGNPPNGTWKTSYGEPDWTCFYSSVLGSVAIPFNPSINSFQGTYHPTFHGQGVFGQDWVINQGSTSYYGPAWSDNHQEVTVFGSQGGLAPRDVYVMVDFTAKQPEGSDPPIQMRGDMASNLATLVGIEWGDERSTAVYHFQFDQSTTFEVILFPDLDYYNLTGAVIDWSYSNELPEPATLGLLAAGGLVLLRRRWKA